MTTVSLSDKDIAELYREIFHKADKIIERLLALMFLFGIFIASFYDTWFVAVAIGSLSIFAYYITKKLLPDSNLYQYVLSVVTTIFAAQYIYQMHGMAEMHFWVFISSTALIVYQNWRLQLPMIVIVYIHHGTFAYLQYAGFKEVYFTQLEYMDLTTFLFHVVLATGVCGISALWGYNIRQRTLRDASNFKTLSLLQKELHESHDQMRILNENLTLVNREIREKNEELLASEEELTASSDALKKTNENLNDLVGQRTQALLRQNNMLVQHAFLNAHKVRSPLARILGLVNILRYEMDTKAVANELITRLSDSASELDTVLKEVKVNLEEAEYDEGRHKNGL
jgi:signal transduction histidine kinase